MYKKKIKCSHKFLYGAFVTSFFNKLIFPYYFKFDINGYKTKYDSERSLI